MDPYLAARVGDLSAIQQWAETNKSQIDNLDEHMRSVLYYAGLCGHEGIVRYLLTIGASVGKYDAISALTPTIRLMLETNDPTVKTSGRHQETCSFLLFDDVHTEYKALAKEGFYAH